MIGEGGGLAWVAAAGAAVFFLLDLALSVAGVAVVHLSRVAVRRLSQDTGLAFLETLKLPSSSYRMALQFVRQLSLLGGSILASLAARAAGWPRPWLVGMLCGGIIGVLLIETIAARGLAQRDPRAALRAVAPVIRMVHAAGYPLFAALAALLSRVTPPGPLGEAEREEEQEVELDALIEVGERDGILEADEGKMMRSIVYMGDTLVREIMTPRTDIVAFPASRTVAALKRDVAGANYSRFPVYRDTIDNVVGILHVRDVLRAWEEGRDGAPITALLRPAFFVPETQSVSELLGEMRIRTHLALVVDEYGGIAGLVTLEDLLEEIVGDIRDEHDVEESLIQEEGSGSWLVSGLAHVEQLEDMFGLDVGERDFDTVGGLVVSKLGRVPAEGETLEACGLRIEVVQADRRRVYRVRLRRDDDAGKVRATS